MNRDLSSHLLRVGALIALGLVLFLRTSSYDFVWDDGAYHFNLENEHLNEPTWGTLLLPWKGQVDLESGRPLLYTPVLHSFWMIVSLVVGGAGEPPLYHQINVALHITNALLVYWILVVLSGGAATAALLGAILFSIHPLQVESVAWVSQARGLLCATFSLASILAFVKTARGSLGPRLGAALALVLFVLACLTKPSAVILPAVFLILDLTILERPWSATARALVPFLVVSLIVTAVTKQLQPDEAIGWVAPLWQRPFLAGQSYAFYIIKTLFPLWLSPCYGETPQRVVAAPLTYVAWLLPVALAWLGWRWRGTAPMAAAGIGIFLVALLPTSGLVAFSYQDWSTVADRYVYFPLLGIAMAWSALWLRWRTELWARWSVVAISALWALLAYLQTPVWADALSLWNRVIDLDQGIEQAYFSRGTVYQSLGENQKGLADLLQGAAIVMRNEGRSDAEISAQLDAMMKGGK